VERLGKGPDSVASGDTRQAMRVVFVVHQDDAGPGVFTEAARGWEVVEWRPPSGDSPPAGFDALVTFGGGMHVDQEEEHPWLRGEKDMLRDLLDRGVPVLGVCLGAQLVAEAGGADVGEAERPEIGWHSVDLTGEPDPLFDGLPERFEALEWHSYRFELPPGATALARNRAGVQAFRAGDRAWGVQFHAEVTGETLEGWFERYRGDDDVRAAGADIEAVARQTPERIGDWNRLGRELCTRFLAQAR
jgi:GMP synthase (glutamine-hydrolysing)